MARRVFYSFHYKPDNWRASQVRNMGVIEGNRPCTDNEWETITGSGDKAIKKWRAEQLDGKPCAVVLIGAKTAGRKWINYEIEKAWGDRKASLVYMYTASPTKIKPKRRRRLTHSPESVTQTRARSCRKPSKPTIHRALPASLSTTISREISKNG